MWDVLYTNYQYLPAGNAYGEYDAKLIKIAKVQDARTPATLTRKIQAREQSHLWQQHQSNFVDVRVELKHNIKPKKMAAKEVRDFSNLASVMVGQKRKRGEGGEFNVKKILDKKKVARSTKYYVEWKGSATKTWEPLKNLQGCIELVEKFDNRFNKQ